ncbi:MULTISPECIES: methionine synthase [unclassified Luteococcus]|uniref:methionine synthase n=1 Tax=unclassified Luteococcus TaxID=2639923 RepID=UPI00313D74C8
MSIIATGIGSLPGEDLRGALTHVLGGFEHAWLPELPARGIGADMIGRSLAMTEGLGFDLQPQGWRLTDASGRDHARARGLLRRDLDDLEELAQGFGGSITLTVAGPLTLAACLERARGDKVLADHGARREMAESLGIGVSGLLAELARRLPDVTWWVQLDEPLLPAVLAGRVPTASGFSRLRSLDAPRAGELLRRVTGPVRTGAARVTVHCCAPGMDLGLLGGSGADGVGVDAVSLDVATLRPADLDCLAGWLEAGRDAVLGLAPTASPDQVSTPDQIVRRGLDLLRPLQLDPQLLLERLAVSTACGLAGWSVRAAITQLDALPEAAVLLAEQLVTSG